MNISGAARRDDGARIRFQVRGRRGAPVLLLLQGQANHHGWWDPLRESFSSDFLTLTLDYRGTGDSSTATDPATTQWTTPAFADDVAAVLRATDTTRAHVYATSMGGRVAQHLAAGHPELVNRLVLACTSPGRVIGAERDMRVRRLLTHGSEQQRRRALIDLFFRPAWVETQGGYAHVPQALLGDPNMTREARAGHLRASDTHDATEVLARITAPTLVIHGDDDHLAPVANADVLASRIPRAQVRIFVGGRHGFFHEMQDVVTPVVLRHLHG